MKFPFVTVAAFVVPFTVFSTGPTVNVRERYLCGWTC